jgi:branched-chain amino acid transport system ATP-binding protein
MSLLSVSDLTVSFGAALALHGVSLQVAAGETVAVLGANGAGKSTLLRTIMGRVPVAGGALHFDGKAIAGAATSARVALGLSLCPEGRQLFPAMSVEDNLLLGAHLAKNREAQERLESIYQLFGWLRDRRRELAGRFSGGEQQMVAIGRALMAKPRLLLMDEPSSGLSPIAVAGVRDILHQVRSTGMSILIVEQNIHLAAEVSERCYVLQRGRMAATGLTADVIHDPALADAYIGELAEATGPGK